MSNRNKKQNESSHCNVDLQNSLGVWRESVLSDVKHLCYSRTTMVKQLHMHLLCQRRETDVQCFNFYLFFFILQVSHNHSLCNCLCTCGNISGYYVLPGTVVWSMYQLPIQRSLYLLNTRSSSETLNSTVKFKLLSLIECKVFNYRIQSKNWVTR